MIEPAELTQAQRDAIAKADAAINPALRLYEERNKVAFLVYRLPLHDLVRLNQVLARLTEDDLRRVATYAEALAEWGTDAPQAPPNPK